MHEPSKMVVCCLSVCLTCDEQHSCLSITSFSALIACLLGWSFMMTQFSTARPGTYMYQAILFFFFHTRTRHLVTLFALPLRLASLCQRNSNQM